MTVERKGNEIIVRICAGSKASKIQSLLDYLRFEELTSKSTATQDEVDSLLKEVKKGRLESFKKETGIDE